MRSILAVLTCALAWPALADTQASDTSKPDPDKAIPRSIFALDGSGNATHLQSQLQCPAAFGDYRRHDLHVYDAFGLDISCDYLNEGEGDITLYLTKRTGGDLKADFEAGKTALTQRVPGAALLPDVAQKTFPSDREWLHTLYASNNGNQIDGLWYAWYGDWVLEVRATYRADHGDAVLAMIAQMTDGARATGAHLARCAALATPIRNGQTIQDGDKITELSLIAGVSSAAAGLPDKTTGKPLPDLSLHPDEWCVESQQTVGDTPMLLWHGIKADGTALAADRLTVMTYSDPPVLSVAEDPTLELILSEENKNDTPKVFVATMTDGEVITTFGFFDGRPDGVTLAKIMDDIHSGKARSYGSFNKKTNTINVVTPPKKD